MNIKELNEAFDEILNESGLRYDSRTKEERIKGDAEIQAYLEEIYNLPENQKVMSGNIDTFNSQAKNLLKPFEDGMKDDIRYAIEKGENVKEHFDYILTETLTDTISLTTKYLGEYTSNDEVIQQILTKEDYDYLVKLNSEVEEKFPYDQYHQEFDLVYSYTFNKLINYAKENFDKWYDEVKSEKQI